MEPTKDPQISISYNEDAMDVEMYSFLNKGDASSYDNTLEEENGVYSIALSNEWVYPMSGTVFFIRKDARIRAREEALREAQAEEKKQSEDKRQTDGKAQHEEKAQDKKAASNESKPLIGNGERN